MNHRYVCLLGVLLAAGLNLGCEPGPERFYFHDTDGRIVIYHGINVCNAAKTAPDFLPWHTKEDFARLRDWGFNAVRYLVFWEAIEPVEGHYDEAYLDKTLERLRWLDELGIDVVVDVHQDVYARKFTGNGFPPWAIHDGGIAFHARQPWNVNYLEPAVLVSYTYFWNSEYLKAKYIAMLEHLLKRVGGLPNVVGVDVMNEPFPALDFSFEADVLSPFYEDIQSMWQKNGFKPRMFFEAFMFNSTGLPVGLTFKPDANCVYAPHYYDPLCHEGASYGSRAKFWLETTLRRRVTESQRFATPMLVGEFGIAPDVPGYLDFLSDFMKQMDRYHISWTYYSYDRAGAESFGVLDDQGNETAHLTQLVRIYPQRIAGCNPKTVYGERSFELSYEAIDTTAPTVVFIPRTLTGVQVFVNGQRTELAARTSRIEMHNAGCAGAKQSIRVQWN